MSKVVFFAASLLLVAGVAFAGIINPCGSPVVATIVGTPCYFACPQGDTGTIQAAGFSLAFTINDASGNPIPAVSFADFWLVDCDATNDMALCAGSASSNADSSTNSAGKTTMTVTTLAVGGCVTGLAVAVQEPGTIPCTTPVYCYTVKVRSCDLNGDLLMNSQDVAIFSTHYPPYTPPNGYDTCSDFDCNSLINSQDLARLAFHYGPPQHKCQ
jgi:hypothetical protein